MRAIQPKPLVDRRSTRHLVQGSWYGECGAKVSRTVRGATRSQAKHMCKGESGILLAKAMLRSKHIEIPLSLHTCDLGAEFTQCMPYNHCCTPNHTSSPHFPPPPHFTRRQEVDQQYHTIGPRPQEDAMAPATTTPAEASLRRLLNAMAYPGLAAFTLDGPCMSEWYPFLLAFHVLAHTTNPPICL